jgi:hypothetical protein
MPRERIFVNDVLSKYSSIMYMLAIKFQINFNKVDIYIIHKLDIPHVKVSNTGI